jgi:hypothetical protein
LLIDKSAGAIVHFSRPNFDSQRIVGNLADWNNGLVSQRAAEPRSRLSSIGDHANMKEVPNAVGLSALENEVLEQAVERIRDAVGLALLGLAAERFLHGAGLVQEKNQGSRVSPADFSGVGQGFLLSRCGYDYAPFRGHLFK